MPDIKLRAMLVMHTTTMFRDARMQAILLGIALASTLCWGLLATTMPMEGTLICDSNGIASTIPAWSAGRASGLLAMWGIMTPAMMLPGAAFAIMQAAWEHRGDRKVYATATCFAAGYLLIVLTGGLLAALAQWALESTGTVIGWTTMADPLPSGLLLVAAGLHQLSPLRRTSKPLCGILAGGDDGDPVAIVKGLRHGRSRFGCCAGMICLQFAGGAMNLGWMAFLTVWMSAEAVLPWKKHVAVLAGTTLLVAGGLCLGAAS
ncbi:copper chaperone [Rhizobium sp. A37_96]